MARLRILNHKIPLASVKKLNIYWALHGQLLYVNKNAKNKNIQCHLNQTVFVGLYLGETFFPVSLGPKRDHFAGRQDLCAQS